MKFTLELDSWPARIIGAASDLAPSENPLIQIRSRPRGGGRIVVAAAQHSVGEQYYSGEFLDSRCG